MQPRIFYSNRVERLYAQFRKNIFSDGGSLFSRRLVVVPSQAIHQWLRLQMAQDPELGICAGVELCYLDQAVDSLFAQEKRPPAPEELTLRLEWEIRRVWDEDSGPLWEPVWRYLLLGKGGKWKQRSLGRLSELCGQLSTLFRQYGIFAPEMVSDWREHWQGELWNRVFPDGSPWATGGVALEGVDAVHLLTMSFIPPLTGRLLIQSGCPIYYYHFSPCCAFWTDIRSDRESRGLRRFLEKQGVNKGSMEELEGYLRDRNTLLANFGRMGRQMAEMLEEMGGEVEEDYVLPASLSSTHGDQADFSMVEVEEATPSLLTALQADLLFLRNPKGEGHIEVGADRSIQLHRAPSRRREVEILYDNLMRNVDTGLSASDVIVMAPNIMDYKSHIEAVFGGKESLLDYQIMDVSPEETNGLVRVLFLLWALSESRFELSSLFALFDHAYFRERWGVSEEDVGRWRSWCREVGIHWGGDVAHRNWLLRRNYCSKELVDGRPTGTWEEGLRRLAEGVVTGDRSMALTDIPLLTKLMTLVRSLREDLRSFIDGTEKRVDEWLSLQMELLEKYFRAPSEEWEWLESHLRRLRQAGEAVEAAAYPFLTVQKLLKDSLVRQTVVVRESHLTAVRFCSMLPLRAIPVPVIGLLGMEEGAFPGVNRLQSLNAMVGDERAEYCPTRTDYDRYLFLETLLSARKQLLISYRATDQGEELAPSLLVSELLQYLDSGYLVEGERPTEALVTEHPFHRYDAKYFRGDRLQSYQKQAHELALRHYQKEPSPPFAFIQEWFHGERSEERGNRPLQITVEELERFARNPLKSYLNGVLGLFVNGEVDEEEEDRFSLSALDKARIRRDAIVEGEEAAEHRADASGLLPTGLFRDVALQEVHEGVEEWQRHLGALNLSMDSLFSVTLATDVDRLEEVEEGCYVAPAIRLECGEEKVEITGKLRDLSSEGMLAYGRDTIEDVCRAWPRFLLVQHAAELPMERRDLLLLKSGTRRSSSTLSPDRSLREYLETYFQNLRNPVPLIPEWIAPMLKGKDAPANLKETFEGTWRSVYSDELSWAFRGVDRIAGPELMERWRPDIQRLFGEMVEEWFQKRR